MLNRDEFKKLSRIRIKEARILIDSQQYNGAYYLAGYAVECALKACIAKKTKRYEFPDKGKVNESWTHNLNTLVRLAELRTEFENDMQANRALELNWAIIKDWAENSRYISTTSKGLASDLYRACTSRQSGILNWIKKKW